MPDLEGIVTKDAAIELLKTIISNPVFDYIAAVMVIMWLSSHGSSPDKPFLDPIIAATMIVTIHAALIGNALGGVSGLAALLK